MEVKRGDIWVVDLMDAKGSEQKGVRPAVIVQNDVGNHFAPTTLVVPLTTKLGKLSVTHVRIAPESGTPRMSEAICEQARVADKGRLIKKVGQIDNPEVLREINEKIKVAFGL